MTPDIAITWLLINLFLVVTTLIWGIYRYRRGIWYRKLGWKVQAYFLWSIGGLALISSCYPFAFLYTEHLWFYENVGYANVFWKIIKTRWGLFFGFFLVAFVFMNANAAIANRLCPEPREFSRWTHQRTTHFLRSFFVGTIILSILFAIPMMPLHDELLRYIDQPEVVITDVDNPNENQSPTDAENPNQNQETIPATLYFGKDTNFYLFSLPMHKAVSLWVWILLWTTCAVVGLLYNFYYRRDARSMGFVKRNIVFHGSLLWLMLLITGIWRSYTYLWGMVYTKSATPTLSKWYGLFYMDNQLAGTTFIYCGVLIGIGVVVFLNLFWRKRMLWYISLVVWCFSYVSLIQIFPRVSHYVNVQTDELITEGKFLEKHIASTRAAFDLDTIIKKNYTAGPATIELINKPENREVLENIQLWDRRVLYDILRAEHNVKHHNFHPYTDIDRYYVNNIDETGAEEEDNTDISKPQYRQVLIAAREIDPDPDVQGKRGNWRNRKLKFTHGYGVYVVPVNEVDAVGDEMAPVFWTEVKLNPERLKYENSSLYPELEVLYPRIYYGEKTSEYVVVNTKTNEYDIESEVTNVSEDDTKQVKNGYHYEGTGGVQLNSWLRRLLFSIRFLDFQIIYNKESVLSSESRIMFWRKIGTRRGKQVVFDRISHIAPFLEYDPDPYIVIANGQLWWIVDYYVTSKWYPSAQFYNDDTALVPDNFQEAELRYRRFNYIRNPGVAIVNAFSGEVNFYAVKHKESIMSTYLKSFPTLFKEIDEMPSELRSHLRFPDYLTRIQAKMYKDYYVEDPEDFQGTGRQMRIPKEVYGDAELNKEGKPIWRNNQEMMPYYAMIRLPGEEKMEFVNMIPFTPQNKEFDMKAWMVVRCDPPHYGERIIYFLTNDPEIKGPKDVENQITLKKSKDFLELSTGSIVMRSSLQTIPLDNGIFFVEAIYQKPDAGIVDGDSEEDQPKRPLLRDIAVVANDLLASDPNFNIAVRKAVEVGLKTDETISDEPTTNEEKTPTIAEEFAELLKTMEALGKSIRALENASE